MKLSNRKNKGFINCVPDMFLATVFIIVAGIVICYYYDSEQKNKLDRQTITKIVHKNNIEIKK